MKPAADPPAELPNADDPDACLVSDPSGQADVRNHFGRGHGQTRQKNRYDLN